MFQVRLKARDLRGEGVDRRVEVRQNNVEAKGTPMRGPSGIGHPLLFLRFGRHDLFECHKKTQG